MEPVTVAFSDCTDWYRNEFPWFFSHLPQSAHPKSDELCRAFHEELMEVPEYRPIEIESEIDTPEYHCRHYPSFLVHERYGNDASTTLTLPHFIECTIDRKLNQQHLKTCGKSNSEIFTNGFRVCLVDKIRKSEQHPSISPEHSNIESIANLWIEVIRSDEEYNFRWAQKMLATDPIVICRVFQTEPNTHRVCRVSKT